MNKKRINKTIETIVFIIPDRIPYASLTTFTSTRTRSSRQQ